MQCISFTKCAKTGLKHHYGQYALGVNLQLGQSGVGQLLQPHQICASISSLYLALLLRQESLDYFLGIQFPNCKTF